MDAAKTSAIESVDGRWPPRFSIIIPAFNSAATLARAVESVQKQSWPAYEIIVVDDGSTDATADIARQFGATVRLIRQTNSGVSAARNAGAAAATGDWLAFWTPMTGIRMIASDCMPNGLQKTPRWIF